MEAVLGPDTPQGEGSVAGAGEVGLDGGQLLELGHEPGQRWPHDNGDTTWRYHYLYLLVLQIDPSVKLYNHGEGPY